MKISEIIENREIPICCICDENPQRVWGKTCSSECSKEYKKLINRIRSKSEKGKESFKKYRQSEKGKETIRRYKQSKKYLEYIHSDKYKTHQKASHKIWYQKNRERVLIQGKEYYQRKKNEIKGNN